jgi:pimeloyl-ACP methyl ester carboxylesterase
MRTVYSSSELDITHQQGDGQAAVLSFTGVGLGLGAVQIEEFKKSLAGRGKDVYFIIDKTKQWYNSTWSLARDLLNQDLDRLNIGRCVTLGNSMGGFGALIFAGRIHGCVAAVAFSPQSCVDPQVVPWDPRWRRFTDSIAIWNRLDAAAMLSPSITYRLYFGADDPFDAMHAARLAAAAPPSMEISTIQGSGHNVAKYLRQIGKLQPILDEYILA